MGWAKQAGWLVGVTAVTYSIAALLSDHHSTAAPRHTPTSPAASPQSSTGTSRASASRTSMPTVAPSRTVSTHRPTPAHTTAAHVTHTPTRTSSPSASTSSASPTTTSTSSSPTNTSSSTSVDPTTNIRDFSSSAYPVKRPGEAWAPWEMYGYLQISISVENGRIIEVRLDRFPDSSRGSNERSLQLLPRLIDDLMSAQTEQLNYGGLTGATYTVEAWKSALHELFVKAGL